MGFGKPRNPNRYPYCGCKFDPERSKKGILTRTEKCSKHSKGNTP